MIILRGVNIYPGQIDEVLSGIADAGSEYQIHLERKDDGKEYMTIKVEAGQSMAPDKKPELSEQIKKAIQTKILVSCAAEIHEHGTLPRYAGKAQRIFDNREV
jgi:phenylacetate-CoA ligase